MTKCRNHEKEERGLTLKAKGLSLGFVELPQEVSAAFADSFHIRIGFSKVIGRIYLEGGAAGQSIRVTGRHIEPVQSSSFVYDVQKALIFFREFLHHFKKGMAQNMPSSDSIKTGLERLLSGLL